ncbi:hypothetical protein BC827DRAFT_1225967 [Russula dissimulans]|nr:hypothetical protein BC827DRAFT_1225967 [Russula dissimulans]
MSTSAPFTFSQRAGLIFLAQTSALSASTIIGLLSYIAYSAVTIIRGSSRRWRIKGAAEIFFLNQLGWDLVQAAGGLMNIKWAVDGSVQPGAFCVAQGAVKHMSDVGAALSTLTITIYTLKVLCFPRVGEGNDECYRRKSVCLALGVVVGIWLFLGLLVGINIATDGSYHFYGPTGCWCWIRSEYSVQRTAADFAFMWITATINIVSYIMVFLYLKGYIATKGWRIIRPDTRHPISLLSVTQVYGLLFYPLVYTLAILPLSLARYLSFAHHYVPFAVTVFVDMIYLASGLFNVLLFSFTRPFLLPHDPRIPNMAPKPKPPHILHREDQGNGVDTMPPATPREFAIEYQRPPVHSTDEDTLLSSEAGSCETRVNNSSEKPLDVSV